MPSPEDVERAVARWGIRPDSVVVVYDDNAGMSAARAWWLLRWIGHERVQVLDGGLSAWRAAGGQLTDTEPHKQAEVSPTVGDRGSMPTVDADDITGGRVEVVLDARAAERFRGEHEPVDPVAGHIPGAISAPTTDNLTDDGHFRTADELRARFDQFGIRPGTRVAVYCGSGVTAAHEILALELAGVRASLYPGSWSGWIADPEHEVATGPD